MEIKRFITICRGTFIFLFITVMASCEDFVVVDCGDCYTDPPVETSVEVKINENYIGGSGIVIEIFDGDYEDGILVDSFTLYYSSDTPIKLPLNKKYSFVANYSVDGISYITFDETTPSVKYSTGDCEDACYYIYGDNVDLRLKYTED